MYQPIATDAPFEHGFHFAVEEKLVRTRRVRFVMPERVPEIVFRAAAASGVYLARAPVLVQGRVELLWYLREQSISIDYHRYGNLGIREGDERMGVS